MHLKGKVPAAARAKLFLGSYPLRLLFPNGAQGFVGRGSSGLLGHLNYFGGEKPGFPLMRIGNFCESAECRIVLDGEHRNSRIFNGTQGSFLMLKDVLRESGETGWQSIAKATTEIGHGVVISIQAIILSGAQIGNGAVIGAGCVVPGEVPPFAIAAGNPFRVIRNRLSEAQMDMANALRWWDFDVFCYIRHCKLLHDIERNFDYLKRYAVYDESQHTVVIHYRKSPEIMAPMTISVAGYDLGGMFVPIEEAPDKVRSYFAQMYMPENAELTWVPDIFRDSPENAG